MPTELFTPISISEGEEGRNFKRVIDDNFTNLARHLNDVREWIDSSKYREIRNTYVFSDQDSLDASYPFEMDFEIVSEMTAIQSIKLSFRIRQFRAYAKAVPSGGGHTTPSGGGHTTPGGGGATSGATGSASGGGHTSGAGGGQTSSSGGGQTSSTASLVDHGHYIDDMARSTSTVDGHEHIYFRAEGAAGIKTSPTHTHTVSNHTHTVSNHTHTVSNHTHPNHTHTTPDHTHTVSNHTHTVSNHTHSLTFGIYEDSQSPTITFKVDNGSGYGSVSADFTTDQLDIDITSSISGVGFKRIKFETDLRCRISGWVLCKIDLTA